MIKRNCGLDGILMIIGTVDCMVLRKNGTVDWVVLMINGTVSWMINGTVD